MRNKDIPEPPENITPRTLDTLKIIEQKRTYELITPLYGGGIASNEADPVTVVRATEIRGLLRFWWRVIRGGQSEENKLSSMQKREDEIWGKAYKKGDKGISPDQIIQIVVNIVREGIPIKPFEMRGRRSAAINDIPGYVSFPLQPPQDVRRAANPSIPFVRQGVRFILTITYPEHWCKDIQAALWAWETFGGLGARTRRGFGALHLVAIDGVPDQSLPTARNAESWIRDQIRIHNGGKENFPDGLPHLSSNLQLVVTPPSANAMLAWNRLIRRLQSFRQQKDANQRSAWPEADTIRNATGRGPAPQTQKFPRAAFGLPLIFHFTGNNAPDGNYTLNEAETERKSSPNDQHPSRERFASPLILRPFLCSDKQAVGLGLLLEGSRVDLKNLVLKDKNNEAQQVNGTVTLDGVLTTNEARAIAQKSSEAQDRTDALRILQSETDVLQAFMKSLKGF